MKNIITLSRRELAAYFLSPLAYVIMTAFLFFTGYFFQNWLKQYPDVLVIRGIIDLLGFIVIFFVPMITMRLIAEENKNGTLETLMTAPVTETEVVAAKYISSLIFFLVVVAPTLAYVFLLDVWGNIDYGIIISSYAGLILLTSVFLSVGIFVSALTSNQIIAVIITFVILLVGYFVGYTGEFAAGEGVWKNVLKYAGFYQRITSFSKGLIDSRDIVYFFSLIVFFLFLTVRILESRRWR